MTVTRQIIGSAIFKDWIVSCTITTGHLPFSAMRAGPDLITRIPFNGSMGYSR